MESIKSGTIEPLLVHLNDKLNAIIDLGDVTNLRFDVKDKDGNSKIANAVPTFDGMTAICLVDTTAGGNWANGQYGLYLKFSQGSQSPVLRPVWFNVDDD